MLCFVSCNCFVHFVTVNVIGILDDADFFCIYLTDDTDSKTRAREWLTEYQFFRNAEFQSGFADFIFEEVTQRLDDFFEIYIIRKSSYVVVGLDHCRFSTETTFYIIAVYMGSVGVSNARHSVAAGLLGDLGSLLAAVAIVNIMWF